MEVTMDDNFMAAAFQFPQRDSKIAILESRTGVVIIRNYEERTMRDTAAR